MKRKVFTLFVVLATFIGSAAIAGAGPGSATYAAVPVAGQGNHSVMLSGASLGQHAPHNIANPLADEGASITYQGRLIQNGMPVSGTVALTFRLFDDPSSGSQVGNTVSIPNQAVSDGLFTAELAFGEVINGKQLWLEVTVNGSALSSRQKITAAPYADSLRPGADISGTQSGPMLTVANGSPSGSAICAKSGDSDPTSCTFSLLNPSKSKSDRPNVIAPAIVGINAIPGDTAILGLALGNLGAGVQGGSPNGVGVGGTVGGASMVVANTGVAGISPANGIGVGGASGIAGQVNGPSGSGVFGIGALNGVVGATSGTVIAGPPFGLGVGGFSNGNQIGVAGASGVVGPVNGPPGSGVFGIGALNGVIGATSGTVINGIPFGVGVGGFSTADRIGVAGSSGVAGPVNGPPGTGVFGTGALNGVIGTTSGVSVSGFPFNVGVGGFSTSSGVAVGGLIGDGPRAYANISVAGSNTVSGVGVGGFASGPNETITTIAPPKTGVIGASTTGPGVVGATGNAVIPGAPVGNVGVVGASSATGVAVAGVTNNTMVTGSNVGVLGDINSGLNGPVHDVGVAGMAPNTGVGVGGASGIIGVAPGGTGVFGIGTTIGVFGKSANLAGRFDGDVQVNGTLNANVKNFRIDDPIDPANKYLYHTSVESPDMMNIYNGNVSTDDKGNATVTMPAYFQALNQDFRYQLTAIGQFAQAMVSSEIRDNRFTIKTDKPLVKVSWQVTGIRHDPYAEKHPSPVEQDKPAGEKGLYLHPELYGQPASKQIGRIDTPTTQNAAKIGGK